MGGGIAENDGAQSADPAPEATGETIAEVYSERMQLRPHDRRASLLTAERKLQVGRREESPGLLSEDAKAARMRIVVGLTLAIVVVVAVVILMVILGRGFISL